MAKICCVKGCETIDDVTYFQFPNSRTLRKKWLDSIDITGKWTLQSLVCSQHFTETDYEYVRGKQRLRGKVVPTVFNQTPKPQDDKIQTVRKENGNKAETESDTNAKSIKKSRSDKNIKEDTDSESQEEDKSVRKRRGRRKNVPSSEDKKKNDETDSDSEEEDKRDRKRRGRRRKNESSSEETLAKCTRSTRSRRVKSKVNKRTIEDYSDSDDDRLADIKKKEKRKKNDTAVKNYEESQSSDVNSQNDKINSHNDKINSQNDKINSQSDSNCQNENDSFDNPASPEFACPIDVITELTETNEDMELNDSNEKNCSGESSTLTNKEPPKEDIEEILTNYFIQTNTEVASKITEDAKQNHSQSDNVQNDKIDNSKSDKSNNGSAKNDKSKNACNETQMHCNIVDVDFEPKAPSYIEVSVDKNNKEVSPGSPQDCLMLLENVQVEIDPSALLQEPSYDSDVEELPPRQSDPISLLTSSDEDDVILQEPHIDTVDVSDESSDDAPLTSLVKKKPSMSSIMWGYSDYFCMECNFTTDNRGEYNRHKASHKYGNSKIMHVCSLCNYTTASKPQIIRHKKKHKEEKRYKCHACDYKAKHYMSLVYHLKSHEPGKMKHDADADMFGECLSCRKCDFRTKFPSRMIKHRKLCRVPRVKVRVKCSDCDYMTHRNSDMKRHRMRMHLEESDDDYVPE